MGEEECFGQETGQKPTEHTHWSDPRVYIPSNWAVLLECGGSTLNLSSFIIQ